ncbi:MAG: sigma-70 family RNA polymerase sigma factor [Calothrix sp. MO_167.B42]|nr:sigma-70 family RNA polymerase sigma factor [Calothrix sp. MO_167.B42]
MSNFRDSSTPIYSDTSEQQISSFKLSQENRHDFIQLWNLYKPYIEKLCLLKGLRNDEDIKDVVMMTFERAWKKILNNDQSINSFKSWLGKIACNLCIDIIRQSNHTLLIGAHIDEITSENQVIGNISYDYPMSDLLQKEEIKYLHYWIRCLSAKLRYPLILYYYQKKSYSDIAQKLSISQYGVDKRLQQARKILKKHLCRYRSGLDTIAFDETQFQQLESKDFPTAILTDSSVEEINCRITLSCLETLPPVLYNFQHTQDWI